MRCLPLAIVLLALFLPPSPAHAQTPRHTESIILITLDGLRWQELFSGAEHDLFHPQHGGVRDVPDLRTRFWRETPEQRREALMPFFWQVVAKRGVVFGDPDRNARSVVTNGNNFSYPGYNELLTGYADRGIDSNKKTPNPNVTVLEWLHRRDGFRDKVAAFTCWDVFPFIINAGRSGIAVRSAFDPPIPDPRNARDQAVNHMAANLPRYWPNVQYDVVCYYAAASHLRRKTPRVLYVAFGETDDWAHERRYDLYLNAAHTTDDLIRRLWEEAQSLPQYRDKTTLVITTDHGRGGTLRDWTSHGEKVRGSEHIWIAVMGPDTPAAGVVANTPTTQGQVAATVASLLGHAYHEAEPHAAKPLPGVIAER